MITASDQPYFDSNSSNGLRPFIDKMQGNKLYAHINYKKGNLQSWPTWQVTCCKHIF